MKVDFNRKYMTISFYTIITFAICMFLAVLVSKFSVVAGYLKTVADVLAPITWGIAIAYVVNPIMMWSEDLLKKVTDRKKTHPKLTRGISTAFSIVLLIAMLSALAAIFLPQVIDSAMGIANDFSTYITNFETWIYKFVADYPDIANYVQDQFDTIQPKIIESVNNIIPQLANIALKLKDGAIVFVLGLKDFLIGFIVAIYLLCSKEKFIAQMRKVVYAIFPQNVGKSILNISSYANQTLGGFISGKLIDSLIIGIITFISMTIMEMNFAALISVVICVTNIIPFFGPFIGAIPSALLLLVAAPKQVIPFVIFIIFLQLFDGNILGPKILGESTGLSAFWVMFAIFLGGGLFGFAGMILGVPLFAVVYSLIREFIDFLLSKKGLSTETDDYTAPVCEPKNNKKNNEVSKPQTKYFTNLIRNIKTCDNPLSKNNSASDKKRDKDSSDKE